MDCSLLERSMAITLLNDASILTSTSDCSTSGVTPGPSPSQRRNRSPSTRSRKCRVLYRGPSLIDNRPIRVVLHSLRGSGSSKLGKAAQVQFCPDKVVPHEATENETDASVCGDCVFRRKNLNACYVVVPLWASPVWRNSDVSADLDEACETLNHTGLPVRLGSWGDPGCAPYEVSERIAIAARGNHPRPRHTGYSNLWSSCDQQFRHLVMASVWSAEQRDRAKAMGWRSYRIRLPDQQVLKGEIVCPASEEGGKRTTCAECLVCCGGKRGPDVVTSIHGSRNKLKPLRALLSCP